MAKRQPILYSPRSQYRLYQIHQHRPNFTTHRKKESIYNTHECWSSPEDISETTEEDTIHNNNNTHKPDGQLKEAETNKHRIISPAFDLSTKRIEFDNGPNRVTYEVKCHPSHSTILNSLLIKLSVLDPLPPYDTNVYFIPHGLIQSTVATIVKK